MTFKERLKKVWEDFKDYIILALVIVGVLGGGTITSVYFDGPSIETSFSVVGTDVKANWSFADMDVSPEVAKCNPYCEYEISTCNKELIKQYLYVGLDFGKEVLKEFKSYDAVMVKKEVPTYGWINAQYVCNYSMSSDKVKAWCWYDDKVNSSKVIVFESNYTWKDDKKQVWNYSVWGVNGSKIELVEEWKERPMSGSGVTDKKYYDNVGLQADKDGVVKWKIRFKPTSKSGKWNALLGLETANNSDCLSDKSCAKYGEIDPSWEVIPVSELQEGNVAYYAMDYDTYNLSDSSGNGNTLTNSGATNISAGKINEGFEFDGSNDYLLFDELGLYGKNFSFAFWLNLNSNLADKKIFQPGDEFNVRLLTGGSNNIHLNTNNGVSWADRMEASITTGEWTHIAITYNTDTGWKMYADGSLADTYATQTFTIQAWSNTLGLDSNCFDGKLDEFGIWNRTLNESEILWLNASRNPWTYTPPVSNAINLILIEPLNASTEEYGSSVNFGFNISGDNTIENCSLYINSTLNVTNSSVTETTNNFSVTFNEVSTFSWYIECKDDSSNTNTSETRIILYVNDTTAPVVELISPANNTAYEYGTEVTVSFNVTDDLSIANCTLYINETVNQTNTSITTVNNSFKTSAINEKGTYTWKVTCFDTVGNTASSPNRVFTTYYSVSASFAFCTGVTLYFAPNWTYWNGTVLNQPATLANGTGACSINVTNSGLGPVNFTFNATVDSSHLMNLQNGSINMTINGTPQVIGSLLPGTSNYFNLTGRYVNATAGLTVYYNYSFVGAE